MVGEQSEIIEELEDEKVEKKKRKMRRKSRKKRSAASNHVEMLISAYRTGMNIIPPLIQSYPHCKTWQIPTIERASCQPNRKDLSSTPNNLNKTCALNKSINAQLKQSSNSISFKNNSVKMKLSQPNAQNAKDLLYNPLLKPAHAFIVRSHSYSFPKDISNEDMKFLHTKKSPIELRIQDLSISPQSFLNNQQYSKQHQKELLPGLKEAQVSLNSVIQTKQKTDPFTKLVENMGGERVSSNIRQNQALQNTKKDIVLQTRWQQNGVVNPNRKFHQILPKNKIEDSKIKLTIGVEHQFRDKVQKGEQEGNRTNKTGVSNKWNTLQMNLSGGKINEEEESDHQVIDSKNSSQQLQRNCHSTQRQSFREEKSFQGNSQMTSFSRTSKAKHFSGTPERNSRIPLRPRFDSIINQKKSNAQIDPLSDDYSFTKLDLLKKKSREIKKSTQRLAPFPWKVSQIPTLQKEGELNQEEEEEDNSQSDSPPPIQISKISKRQQQIDQQFQTLMKAFNLKERMDKLNSLHQKPYYSIH